MPKPPIEASLDAPAVQESLTIDAARAEAVLSASSEARLDRVAVRLLGLLSPAERAFLAKRLAPKP